MTATLIDIFTTAVICAKPPHHPGISTDLSVRYANYDGLLVFSLKLTHPLIQYLSRIKASVKFPPPPTSKKKMHAVF